MPDITTTQIAAGLAGTVTVGALIMIILQNVKALSGDRLQGWKAEIAGGIAALVAVVVSFILADADWDHPQTYAELFVGWMGAWASSRAMYAVLFKVSVEGSPPSSAATATEITDTKTGEVTTPGATDSDLVTVSPHKRKRPAPKPAVVHSEGIM